MDANLILTKATRALLAGSHAEAAELAQRVLKKAPANVDAMAILAGACVSSKRHDDAKKWIRKVLAARPGDEAASAYKAIVQMGEGRVDEARRTLAGAIRVRPSSVKLRALDLQALNASGDRAEAAARASELIASGVIDPLVAREFATAAPRVDRAQEAVDYLRRCLESTGVGAGFKIGMWVQLGRLLDGLGEYDAAFEAFDRGNELKRADFDATRFGRRVDEAIEKWTREAIDERSPWGDTSDRPLLIVGMPRSGTTLVEQILGSHPQVAACGELNDLVRAAGNLGRLEPGSMPFLSDPGVLDRLEVTRAAQAYVQTLRRAGTRALRATDKMPVNFLNLGLAAIMVPKARVIHCVRDPRDVCLSCYMFNFSGHMPFAYDLRDLGLFHRMHDRLMRHWREVLRLPILELRYEDMVADQEGKSRELIEFAGLEWDDACLTFYESKRAAVTASYEQVRNPIYTTALERWRRYESHLGPLLEALAGDETPAT
jgi:tetratricopeptide (TPR) repeat protein